MVQPWYIFGREARVSGLAHIPITKATLFSLSQSPFVCVQLNVLLSRLCGEPIGFTVLGIFVIDKNTILTVGDYR